jgi:hypothetical protein
MRTRETWATASVVCALVVVGVNATTCGGSPKRDSLLIRAYRGATCVPPIIAPGVQPPSRQWDRPIDLRDGRRIFVLGLRAPSGAIALRYPGAAQPTVAADAGDYVYPSDVRWNRDLERLYVKAQGLEAMGGERTVLFEYDLAAQRILGRENVEPSTLPPECPAQQEPGK